MRSKVEKIVERTGPGTDSVRTRESYSAALAHVSARTRDLIQLEGSVSLPEDHMGHHEMRIAAKRLRYTIEVFKVLFDDELRADIQTMKGVQDLLGEMHDCDVWTETLPDVTKEIMTVTSDEGLIGPGVNALIADRSKVREEKYTEFVVAWSELRSEGSLRT